MLELRDKQTQYRWKQYPGIPGIIKAKAIKDLPVSEQLTVEKYHGLPWDIDFTMDEFDKSATKGHTANSHHHHHFANRNIKRTASDDSPRRNRSGSTANLRLSVPNSPTIHLKRMSLTVKAQEKWKKLRNCLHFITKVGAKIPDGPRGDLCTVVNEDVDFGRFFQNGANPTILKRCTEMPAKLPVDTDEMESLLERNISLEQEIKVSK